MNEYIIRERIELNFTQVPKSALKDRNLSLKAKGLYAYLFSLPEDWKVFKSEIVNNCTDGKDSLNSAFKELERFGYLESTTLRDEVTKQFVGTSILLRIEPLRISRSGKTHCGKAVNGKSATTNTNITNTDSTNNSLFSNKENVPLTNDFVEIKGSEKVFIADFRSLTGRKFQLVGKALTQLRARLKDGYTYSDILKATRNAMKDEYHKNSNFNYLTPEFITRTDKLEKYLNYVPAKKPDIKEQTSTLSL